MVNHQLNVRNSNLNDPSSPQIMLVKAGKEKDPLDLSSSHSKGGNNSDHNHKQNKKAHFSSFFLCYGKESRLRKHLSEEAARQEEKCEACMKRASAYAAEGNPDAMHAVMDQAQEHAKRAGLYNEGFKARVADIRNSLSEERTRLYHEQQTEHCVSRAEMYANEGNRDLVLHQILKAKGHAMKCQSKTTSNNGTTRCTIDRRNNCNNGNNSDDIMAALMQREQAIHDILKNTEASFHQRKSEHCLQRAARYADDGNREMVHFFLKDAAKHAKKARCYNKVFKGEVAAVQSMLKGTTHKEQPSSRNGKMCGGSSSSHSTSSSTKRSVDEIPLLDEEDDEELEFMTAALRL